MTILAEGASLRMPASIVSSSAGRRLLAEFSPWAMAFRQSLVDSSTQVSMMPEKPTSLPPTVTLTRVVDALSAESWLFMTSVVAAPLHAANVNEASWVMCVTAHSSGYPWVLRSQDPLDEMYWPAPRPAAYESPSAT
jgi:hypothetical protein